MRDLQLFLMKNILGFVLQSFAMVLGIYAFNRKTLVFKDYLVTSVIVTIISYLMKLLPITVGVQTILNMFFVYLLCVLFLKMPPYKTIRSTSICFVLILLCEMIVTAIAVKIIGQDQFEVIISDPMKRYYIGVLANIVFALAITIVYFALRKKGDNYRNTSSQNSR